MSSAGAAQVSASAMEVLAESRRAYSTHRADNALNFIKDLVFLGGRFISTGDGIDTARPGWELLVKVMEMHNSTTITELARRVRSGQKGRLLARLTAGDYPFGYGSFVVHPERLENDPRGPKPERDVRIDEGQARWVRQVFAWFLEGSSMIKIAKELTRLGVRRGRRSTRTHWTTQQVRRMLANCKYIGRWHWGLTTTIRNSKGKKKQIPVSVEEEVRIDRAHLRIIDQETWQRVQDNGPKIVAMRKADVSWEEICKITGLGSGPAYVAWKRCADAETQNCQELGDHNTA